MVASPVEPARVQGANLGSLPVIHLLTHSLSLARFALVCFLRLLLYGLHDGLAVVADQSVAAWLGIVRQYDGTELRYSDSDASDRLYPR